MDLQQNIILDPLGALKQRPTFWNRYHVEKSWNRSQLSFNTTPIFTLQ
jgi:hypothetical protein